MLERTRKVIKNIIKSFIAAIFISLIIGILLIYTIDPNKYKGFISNKITEATGRETKINGDLSWNIFSLYPGITIKDVTFANAAWAKEKHMVSVKEMDAAISLRGLFLGKIYLSRFKLIDPKINLTINNKGQKNWDLEKLTQQAKSEKKEVKTTKKKTENKDNKKNSLFTFDMGFEEVFIKGGDLTFEDKQKKKTENLKIDSLVFTAKSLKSPMYLKTDIKYNNNPYSLTANLGSLNDINNAGKFKIDTDISSNYTTAKIKGYIKNILELSELNFDVDTKITNLKEELKVFKIETPSLPMITAKSKITGNLTYLTIKDLDFKIGNSDISGNIEAGFENKPNITAKLNSNLIDLTEYINLEPKEISKEDKEEAKEEIKYDQEKQQKKIFAGIDLPIEALNSANADADINIEQIKVNSKLTADKTKIHTTLQNGNLLVSPFNLNIADGKIETFAKLDASSKRKMDTEISLKAKKVSVSKLTKAFIKTDRLTGGSTNLDVYIKGSGSKLDSLMASLDGHIKGATETEIIAAKIGDLIIGKSMFDKLLQDYKNKDSVIKCAAATLFINDGMIYSNRGIATEIKDPDVNFVGDGTISLKDEQMDLTFIPNNKDLLKLDTSGVISMIRLKGSLLDPKLVLSGSNLLQETFKGTFKVLLFSAVTGGLGTAYFAKELFNRVTEDDHPCKTARNSVIDEKYLKSINARYNQDINEDPDAILKKKAEEEIEKAKEKAKKEIEEEKLKAKEKAKKEIEKEKQKTKQQIDEKKEEIKDEIKNKLKDKLNLPF